MKFTDNDLRRLTQMNEEELYAVNAALNILLFKWKQRFHSTPQLLEPVAAEVAIRKNWQPKSKLGYKAPVKYAKTRAYRTWGRANRKLNCTLTLVECTKLLEAFSFWDELKQVA